ncbi:MAG: fibronectin type III domain-containing protein [Burkholderiales bacterium]|nr:fibronectin type III domain-containing protein [Burkholderiales bacterium]
MRARLALLGLLFVGGLIAGCGSGGGSGESAAVSSQLVSGVAATGSPLAGQVTLRDSSPERRDKVTVLAGDGSFSIDVSNMQAPFLLRATGTADGVSRTLYSFAGQPGRANINPLSSVALANAAGVDDPAAVFDHSDAAALDKLKSGMPAAVATLQSKLQPLLTAFGAGSSDPVRDTFRADHTGLDAVFDSVRIVLDKGTLTITNATTGALIFSARVKDFEDGSFTDNDDDLPKPGPRPGAPANVTAVGGDGQITVSWDAVANATSYDLFYSTRSSVADDEDRDDGHAKHVRNVASPYVLSGLAADTTYFVMVRAIGNKRRGPPSAAVSATTSGSTPAPTVPAAPTGLSATGGTQQVSVIWDAVSGASSYNLYWSTVSGVTVASGTKISNVTSPAVHTGLDDATTYFYIVTAENSAGEGAASVQAAATTLPANPTPPTIPAAPTGVSALGGDNLVTVSWSAVTGADSYNVYRSTSAGVTPANGTRLAGATSPFVDTGRSASTAYFYIVTAVNSAGESAASVEVNASTNAVVAVVPPAPAGVTATGGAGQLSVSWNSVSSATSYNLYWSSASGVTTATGTKVTGATSPQAIAGLADGTAYFVIVTAVNSAGESAASSQATATTNAAAINGATLYMQNCSGCHGGSIDSANSAHILGSEFQGASAQLISSGIAGVSAMARFRSTGSSPLTAAQIQAIASALTP